MIDSAGTVCSTGESREADFTVRSEGGNEMLSRRDFVSLAAGATVLAGTGMFSVAAEPGPGSVMPTRGKLGEGSLPTNAAQRDGRYRPKYRLGLGGVAIGNGFAPMADEASDETMKSAFETGARFYDTSPWYGLGLSERRFGRFLHQHKPDEYVLSTKIGRLLKATNKPPETMWKQPSPFDYTYDYSASGTRRSIEDSLQRLGVSQIDIVFIHDLSPDNEDMKDRWPEYFDIAAKGAMPELSRMRDEGIIKAWGFGVNRPEPAIRAAKEADPDIFLLACQYSLLDHEQAAEETFPLLESKGMSVVVGAPLLAGYLAGRDRYLYDGTVPDWAPKKRERVVKVADKYGIDLRTAALQFAAAPQVVSAVIPGARSAEQMQANADSMKVIIPHEFWTELRDQGLISPAATIPKQQS